MNQWDERQNGINNFWRTEQSKKNEKNWGSSQRPLGQNKMHQHSNIRVPEEEKKQRYEKIFEEIIVEISPTWKRK